MNKLVLLCICAFGLLSCTTHQAVQAQPPRSQFTDFLSKISYPYQAPEARRLQIERAVRELPVGATEAQVLALLGPPDYKAGMMVRDKQSGKFSEAGEVWHYVHTWDHPLEPGERGKMLIITLSNKTDPRKVTEVSPSGLGKRFLPSSQT